MYPGVVVSPNKQTYECTHLVTATEGPLHIFSWGTGAGTGLASSLLSPAELHWRPHSTSEALVVDACGGKGWCVR